MPEAKKENGLDRLYHRIEALIATEIIDAALKADYLVSIYNGEAYEIRFSNDRQAILDAMSSTDEELIQFHSNSKPKKYIGSIVLIYGNGQDVVHDHHARTDEGLVHLDEFMKPIYKKFGL